ncbi:enoyl-[acyl-carrier-protein] reductase, mitochondrial isoform X1 [Bemisia tabaci]
MDPEEAFKEYQAQMQSFKCKKLVFKEFGDPLNVVHLEDCDVKEPYGAGEDAAGAGEPGRHKHDSREVPVKPKLPATPGMEGVGEIFKTGFNVTRLGEGDRVILSGEPIGSWSSLALFEANDVIKVPKRVPIEIAAGLVINTVTAHRMLTDFVELGPGTNVIQNGANSACGQNIIQLCKLWGLVSINIVRNRPNVEELKKQLIDLGANYVYTEEEFNALDEKDFFFTRPKLALNCVGGPLLTRMLKFMAPGATVVTYGGMSYKPITAPTTSFIFDDLTFKGFWLKRWNEDYRNKDKKESMMNELFELSAKGFLHAPAHKFVPFEKFKEALENTLSPKGLVGHKCILDFREMHAEQEKEWAKEREIRKAKEKEEIKRKGAIAKADLEKVMKERERQKTEEKDKGKK